MAELYSTQDVVIKSCKIISSTGTAFEFKLMLLELNYFEDIFTNFCSGNIIINDSQNFLNKLSLTGNEYLYLTIDRPGLNQPLERVFRVFKVSDKKWNSDNNETYILHFISEEAVLSEQYKVSKTYSGMKIVDMVKDISFNILKINPNRFIPRNIEDTSGIRDITIPNYKPFQAINWLSIYSKSNKPKNIGATFLFYENFEGFNFKSIEVLFEKKLYATYNYELKNINLPDDHKVSDMDKDIKSIIRYEVVNKFNSIEQINSGVFGNKVLTIDPIRRKFDKTVFDYSKYFQNSNDLNKNPAMTNAVNRFGDKLSDSHDSNLKMVFTNTDQSNQKYFKAKEYVVHSDRVEEIIGYRQAQLNLLNLNRMKILIPGDINIKIGDIIQVNIPDVSGDSQAKKKLDEFLSGKYIITALRHIIGNEGTFTTTLEVCKESNISRLSGFNNNDTTFKTLRDA